MFKLNVAVVGLLILFINEPWGADAGLESDDVKELKAGIESAITTLNKAIQQEIQDLVKDASQNFIDEEKDKYINKLKEILEQAQKVAKEEMEVLEANDRLVSGSELK